MVTHIDVFRVRVRHGVNCHLDRTLIILENLHARIPQKPSAIATYSASLEESVVHFCVLEIHWIAVPPHITATPETDFLFVSLGA